MTCLPSPSSRTEPSRSSTRWVTCLVAMTAFFHLLGTPIGKQAGPDLKTDTKSPTRKTRLRAHLWIFRRFAQTWPPPGSRPTTIGRLPGIRQRAPLRARGRSGTVVRRVGLDHAASHRQRSQGRLAADRWCLSSECREVSTVRIAQSDDREMVRHCTPRDYYSTEGQSLVRNASMARWRKVYGFPRPIIPRTRSRR